MRPVRPPATVTASAPPPVATPPESALPASPAVSAPAPATVTEPAVSFTTPDPPAPVAKASPPAPTPTVPPIAAPTTRNPRIIAYVEALRIAGIRPSDTDPRVLMNDRVFRLNDVVDRNLGLRLTAVESQRLVFTDEDGFDYEKRF